MTHRLNLRVYYEDTDLAGIVYHANYFKFTERARSEWVRELGIDQVRLKQDSGLVFAVRRMEAEYLAPARFDDKLTVETDPQAVTGARAVLRQDIWRGQARLFTSTVTLAMLAGSGAPARIPESIRRAMAGL